MDLDKTAEPMNMHDRIARESPGIPSFWVVQKLLVHLICIIVWFPAQR